jgi:hypothetical protein
VISEDRELFITTAVRTSDLTTELYLLPASWWFLTWLILWPWRWRRHVPLEHRLTFNGQHSFISQKTERFTVHNGLAMDMEITNRN